MAINRIYKSFKTRMLYAFPYTIKKYLGVCVCIFVIVVLAKTLLSVARSSISSFSEAASYNDIPIEENVLILNESNFDRVVLSTEFILVEFYAPWCVFYKILAPEYVKVATKLSEEGSAIKVAKVDMIQEQELAKRYGVTTSPVLKYFRKGKPIEYSGARQAHDIITWLKKKTGPPAIQISSVVQAKELIASNPIIIFGYFPKETEGKKYFLTTAENIDEITFAIVVDEKVVKELGAQPEDIVVFKDGVQATNLDK